jgi:hypothetical protein
VIRSSLLDRSALEDSLAIYFIFFQAFLYFLHIFEFYMFSRNVKEIENSKKRGTVLGRLWPTVPALLARPASHFSLPVRHDVVPRSPRVARVGWRAHRRPGNKVLPASTMSSPEMADGGGAEKRSNVVASQWR